jgi:hypothetical protein
MHESTASERLEFKLSLARPALRQHAAEMWDSAPIRLVYPAYLQMMHLVVRSAVPLLEAAAEAAAKLRDDPLGLVLAPYFAHHADEERGHDGWLLADLAATGAATADPREQFPPPCVAEMVGAQYYWIRHFHPITLIGHVAAMETMPPPLGFAEALQQETGYSRAAFTAIRRHAKLDIAHARDLYELIDRLPLSPAHEAMIAASALHTIERGMDILAEIAVAAAHTAAAAARSGPREPEIA